VASLVRQNNSECNVHLTLTFRKCQYKHRPLHTSTGRLSQTNWDSHQNPQWYRPAVTRKRHAWGACEKKLDLDSRVLANLQVLAGETVNFCEPRILCLCNQYTQGYTHLPQLSCSRVDLVFLHGGKYERSVWQYQLFHLAARHQADQAGLSNCSLSLAMEYDCMLLTTRARTRQRTHARGL
jgi:hypothetical protein